MQIGRHPFDCVGIAGVFEFDLLGGAIFVPPPGLHENAIAACEGYAPTRQSSPSFVLSRWLARGTQFPIAP